MVCHGIPNPKQILKDGDIINIDVTPILDGYHGDTSKRFLVGKVSAIARKWVEVTHQSMIRGISEIKPGARIGDIGAAIQEYAEANGFSVVRDMVGHGVGRQFHQFEHTVAVTEEGVEILIYSSVERYNRGIISRCNEILRANL